jgi:hypothetical protein
MTYIHLFGSGVKETTIGWTFSWDREIFRILAEDCHLVK